ncbi:MAG: PEP-CTERM sorting domain-containing protein [Verrucomicrobia bacterium]|nr:PEP-CTERM sorting domain-containing protein [Verrucomicrobiota bacterium]MCH8514522.1 PEP-CTERM sorting domain-containing protein [Kiritimatiellia bacterium]
MNTKCRLILVMLTGMFTSALQADLLLYDGFAAGGENPGSGEYQTEPNSTNGTNNNALHGQSPSALGFSTNDEWRNLDTVAGTVHPRAINNGLTWSDSSGNSLITSPGAAEIFRSGTQSGADYNAQFKRATRKIVGIDGPSGEFYLSGLFQFKAGVEGRLKIFTTGAGDDRSHYIGFSDAGNLIGGSFNNDLRNAAAPAENTSAETFAADTTHFVVARFVDGGFGNRTVDLWINPNDITSQGTADYTFDANYFDGHTFDSITIGAHMGKNVSNPSFIIDEVRVGTTWDSVTPIPEPGTLILLGISLGTLWLFRRRK